MASRESSESEWVKSQISSFACFFPLLLSLHSCCSTLMDFYIMNPQSRLLPRKKANGITTLTIESRVVAQDICRKKNKHLKKVYILSNFHIIVVSILLYTLFCFGCIFRALRSCPINVRSNKFGQMCAAHDDDDDEWQQIVCKHTEPQKYVGRVRTPQSPFVVSTTEFLRFLLFFRLSSLGLGRRLWSHEIN